ncbi:hypothetical protein SAMN05444972_103189 [Marininema halotolerans]|uniref:Uncharacterized protein n=1 Tax=Marininema halotolerans TaxID=1155944 RepID=A0A1I6QJ81_9BACL|nr:hypothetical protein SAMN05444972_103189 [Marininema halotolerans]
MEKLADVILFIWAVDHFIGAVKTIVKWRKEKRGMDK